MTCSESTVTKIDPKYMQQLISELLISDFSNSDGSPFIISKI